MLVDIYMAGIFKKHESTHSDAVLAVTPNAVNMAILLFSKS